MKILSVHPFSLYANGGGSRILRRLYQGREAQVTSLAVEGISNTPKKGIINEHIVYAMPVTRKWMRWHLRNWIIFLREKKFVELTNRRIRRVAAQIPCDIIHVVHHGPFADALCTDHFAGKELWVSFHDHFNTTKCTYSSSAELWNRAHRRFVISDELGKTYQQAFGNKPYDLITDGVYSNEITYPGDGDSSKPFEVYFAGLLHIAYLPLFEVLAEALDKLTAGGLSFKVVLRATQKLPFLSNRLFQTEYRDITLDDEELKAELNSASILYLPIKFTQPDFYLYSLSTKMVGYLGAPGSILYHGPVDSAAYNLLHNEGAASCCVTLNVDDLAASVLDAIKNRQKFSVRAKNLAQNKFDMLVMQNKFWQVT
jgi:glycosyltransferase involved in cell wall biosynthesis